MKYLKQLAASVLTASALLASSAYATPVLSFGNTGGDVAQTYYQGDTVALDLWISGLDSSDDQGGADLAGFDMNLSFNGAVTGYQNTLFSSDLDDSLFYGLAAVPGSSDSLNLSGLSLLFDLSGQASQLKLFTLVFTADQLGTSLLKIDDLLLVNSGFMELGAESFLAQIDVIQKPTSVPEPSSLGLLMGALALVYASRRKAV